MDINYLDVSTTESILALICSIVAAIVSVYVEKRLKSKNKKDNHLIEKMFNRDDLLISDILEQNKQLRIDNKELRDKIENEEKNVTDCVNNIDIEN